MWLAVLLVCLASLGINLYFIGVLSKRRTIIREELKRYFEDEE